MANYKVVNADQLDADLTAVADSIRARAGTTEELTFPEGFQSAVEGIPDLLELQINQKLTAYTNPNITVGRSYMFKEVQHLEYVNLPNLTDTNYHGFHKCLDLKTVITPALKKISMWGFRECKSLETLDLPCLMEIGYDGLYGTGITTLILRNTEAICVMSSTSNLNSTPIANGTGYIYVPRTMEDGSDGVDSYKAATNWSTYADQIRAIEDYPEITGG